MNSTRKATNERTGAEEHIGVSFGDEHLLPPSLVVARCMNSKDRDEIEAFMYVQWACSQPGGLAALARTINDTVLSTDRKYQEHCKDFKKSSESFYGFEMEAGGVTEKLLREQCLNMESSRWSLLRSSISFTRAIQRVMKNHETEVAARIAETEVSRHIFECLEYARETASLVLVEGDARIGKSFAAKNWCERNPARVRYVQVPSSSDEKTFHLKIAEATGVSRSVARSGQDLRMRVQSAVQGLNIMLVFDEAHYLWPSAGTRTTKPKRINWIMTELVNYGIPVVLISTHQFSSDQRRVEETTGWASEQFIGRIGHFQQLPAEVPESDLRAVASFHLPEGDSKSHDMLVDFAMVSKRSVAGIALVVDRARFEARKAGQKAVTLAHIKRVIECYALPSDSALSERINSNKRPRATFPAERETVKPQPTAGRRQTKLSQPENRIVNRAGNLVATT